MTEDILVEVSPGETRIAFVDKWDRLREFLIERINDRLLWEGVFVAASQKLNAVLAGHLSILGLVRMFFSTGLRDSRRRTSDRSGVSRSGLR